MQTLILYMLIAAPLVFGQPTKAPPSETAALRAEIDRLKKQVAELKAEADSNYKAADFTINDLYSKVLKLEQYNTVNIQTDATEGFSRLETGMGPLLVTLKSVAPFLDGYKA